jgi:O-antigen/teichoic acid export membrane protein
LEEHGVLAQDPTTPAGDAAPRPMTGGAVMNAAGRIVTAAFGAATTILIARLLGPDGAGGYAIAQTIVFVLSVLATLGVEHGITYYISDGSWQPRHALMAALRLAALTGLAGMVLSVGARLAFPTAFSGLSIGATTVAAAGLPFWLTWFYLSFIALATDNYEVYAIPPAAQAVLALVLAGGGAIAFGLTGAVVGTTIATALVGIGAAGWGLRRLPVPREPQPAGRLRRAAAFGIKGYAANALQLLNYRLDLFILAAAASAAQVGYYAVAVAVTTVLWLLPQAVSEILFPRVAQLSAQSGAGAEAHREMVELKSARHVVLVVVASVLVLAGALEVLVVPVYGEAFRPAIHLGLILLPGVALLGIGGVFSSSIVGRGKPIYSLYTVLITLPPTVGLYVWLIPAYGATGAALASSLSYAASFFVACAFYRHLTGRQVLRTLTPTRSELADLAALPRGAFAWARRVRR